MKTERKSATATFTVEEELPVKNCRLYRIEGRVQGVFFRESTRRQAEPMGITGYAKNMPDGSVQVLACGAPDALNRLTEWLNEGPPLATVENMGWIESSSDCPGSFDIL